MKTLTDYKNMTRDELLGMLGLETKPAPAEQWMAAIGTFAAGLVVGAGVALLLAPTSGRELRAELKSRIPDLLPPSPQPKHPAPNNIS
jgi:hypothetical protein